jgi:hypothetical protein
MPAKAPAFPQTIPALARSWKTGVYPDVQARCRILEALKRGLTANVSEQELGNALDYIEDAAREFHWRSSVPPTRQSPAKQLAQIGSLATVTTEGRYLQIICSMNQPTLLSVLSRRPPDRPPWSAEVCTLAISAPEQKRKMLELPRYREALLATKEGLQAAAARAYEGEAKVRPAKLRTGPHADDARTAFIKDLITVWDAVTGSAAGISQNPITKKYGGKFLAFADACLRPFGDKAVQHLDNATRRILRAWKKIRN